MAIDDIISDFETSVADGALASIQPASGDEWCLTNIAEDYGGTTWQILSDTNLDEWSVGNFGGNTSVTADIGLSGLRRQIRCFLTNGEFIRVKNSSGTTGHFGYSAIKTKD